MMMTVNACDRLHTASETEWHNLWRLEHLALLEGDAEVDVYQLGALPIDQNVLQVPIAEAHNVPHHRRRRGALRVRDALLEPLGRRRVRLDKEMVEHRLEVLAAYLLVHLQLAARWRLVQ